MDQLESKLRAWVEGKTDFEGQKLAEQIQHYGLISSTAVSFLVGFATQSLRTTFVILGFATAVVALVTVPAWPFYNRHPLAWKPASSDPMKQE